MTLKLADLKTISESYPDVPNEVHVSPQLWDRMSAMVADRQALGSLAFIGLLVVLEPHYRPDFWSEHYHDRTVFHTANSTVTMSALLLRPFLRRIPKKFEIEKLKIEEEKE